MVNVMIEFWASAGRFGITGVLATLVHTVMFLGLIKLTPVRPSVATVISFLCALTFSYRLHHAWTFRVIGQHRTFFARFVVIAVVGAALNFGIMSFMTDVLGRSPLVGLIAVLSVVAPLSFLFNRCWTFR
jgi:putative flippase GtrA